MDKSKKILKRLELLHPKKIDLSLNRLKRLLKKLGNPHFNLPPIIHVAGTNGKGSVTAFLRSILENGNLKTHVYTSPHLRRFNERIRLNSKIISNSLLNLLLEECEQYNDGKQITFFEITTAAAFLAFSRIKSDIILLETGLGGRFDATNVIVKNACSVLTPISSDHTNLLGNSIKKIAIEKLGIIKNNSVAVISKQIKSVNKLILSEAKKKNVKLFQEGKHWSIVEKNYKERFFILKYLESIHQFPFPSLYGDHQIENASTAIATIFSLKNILVKKKSIVAGVLNTKWPARMQNLNNGKLVKMMGDNFEIWLDGGHNVHASEAIFKTIEKWNEKNIILIIGMVQGKDPIKFLLKLIQKIKILIILPINDHEHIQPYEIKNKLITKLNKKIQMECCVNIDEALEFLKKKIDYGKIIICGSLYLAGEILERDGYKIN